MSNPRVCVEEVRLVAPYSKREVDQLFRYDEFDCTGLSDLQIIRKAKKMFGWSGIRCSKKDEGFYLTLREHGSPHALILHKKVTY